MLSRRSSQSRNAPRIVYQFLQSNTTILNITRAEICSVLARRLNMWGIGIGSEEGTIAIKGKVRGSAKAIALLVQDMKERGFRGGRVIITHCQNLELAQKLQSKILELWQSAKVSIMPTRGLCSYYAERNGLIVGYSQA